MSRLKINLGKSKSVPTGNVQNVTELADILGCKVSSLPMKYLGLPFSLFQIQGNMGSAIEKMEGDGRLEEAPSVQMM